ncbi:hypothetical protein IRJ41_023907, partial [Triplophysa rosa]
TTGQLSLSHTLLQQTLHFVCGLGGNGQEIHVTLKDGVHSSPWAAEPGAREDFRGRVTGDRSVEWDGGSATAGINLREGVGGYISGEKPLFSFLSRERARKEKKEVACAPHKEESTDFFQQTTGVRQGRPSRPRP